VAKNNSSWKFVKAASNIHTSKASQKSVLTALASRADRDGVSFPGYERLMKDTSIGSRATIIKALDYLKNDLGILTWVKGWGNRYTKKGVANRYTLNYENMLRVAEKQAHTEALESTVESTPQILESTLGALESTPQALESTLPVLESIKSDTLTSQGERPSKNVSGIERLGARPEKHLLVKAETNGVPSDLESTLESTPDEFSGALAYDPKDRQWYANPGMGRGLTDAEQVERKRRNDLHMKPELVAQ